MASKIKGITVEIGGDTTKLGKALEDVNKKTNSLQSELRGVETLLKLNPNNVVLLQQKQEILNASIENTRDKLNIMKEAQVQVQEQFDKGEITAEQYRDFQRELIQTEQKLGTLEEKAKDFGENGSDAIDKNSDALEEMTGATDGANQGLGRIGDLVKSGVLLQMSEKFKEIGQKIFELGEKALAAFTKVDDGYDSIITATGITGPELEKLTGIFDKIFGKFPFEADQVASAIGEINTRLGFTDGALEAASVEFLKFAKINGIDVKEAVALVSRAMGDAGIESEEYGQVLDWLSVAAQGSGAEISQLTEYITKYGAPMRALGFDTKESIAIFATWEKAGVNTEIAFAGMKKAIGTWGAEGKDARVEFQKTLDAIGAAPDIAVATSMAIEAFGVKAGPDLADAIKGGRFEYQDFVNLLEGSQGTVGETFAATQDGTDKMTVAANNMDLAMASLGEVIGETLAPIFQQLADMVQGLTGWFGGLDPILQQLIVILGVVTGVIMLLIPVIIALAVAQTTFNVAFLPIIGIILAVIAVITAIILVIMNWGTITEWLSAKWTQFKDWIIALAEGLKNSFVQTWEAIKNGVQGAINALWNIIVSVFNGIAGAIKLYVDTYKAVVVGAFTIIKDTISNIINGVMDTIKRIMSGDSLFSIGKDMIQGLINGIQSMIGNVTKIISNLVDGIKNKFKSLLGIKSPSTWMRDVVGKMIPQGIAVGVEADTGKAIDSIEDMSDQIMEASTPEMVTMMNRKPMTSTSASVQGLSGALGESGTLANKVDTMIQILATHLPKLGQEYQMVMDTGAMVGALQPQMDKKLGSQSTLKERGV